MKSLLDKFIHFNRRLFSKEQRRFIKFCLVGMSGIPVNLFFAWIGKVHLFASFDDTLREAAAYLIGIAVSILTNFLLNDLWTWRDRQEQMRGFFGRLLRFYVVCSLASSIQFAASLAVRKGLGVDFLVAPLLGIALATVINFLLNNLWTFRVRTSAAAPPANAAAPTQLPQTEPKQ
jgi:putative flippase GtrA